MSTSSRARRSSGTIVRNLEQGLRRGEELGGAMQIGYLPDMFGHVAQMPQILRLAGIEQAVVWRGVPAAIDSHVFEWEAPDGSSVRSENLPHGYGDGATLLDVPGRLAHRLGAVHESLRAFFGEDPVLTMYGTDHTEPLPRACESRRGRLHGRELFARRLNGFKIGNRMLTLEGDDEDDPFWLDIDELRHELDAATDVAPEETWEVRIVAWPRRKVVANVPAWPVNTQAGCARPWGRLS